MNEHIKFENELIKKIIEILRDFQEFEEPSINKNGDIIIKRKNIKRESNNASVLTDIFREIIKNDVKKNRVWNPVSFFLYSIEYQDKIIVKGCSAKLITL